MFSDIKVSRYRCFIEEGEGITMVVLNILLCILGSIGNILVCLTIVLTPSLHTLSSYCIFNLSTADLLVSCIVEPCLVFILSWKLHGICLVKVEYAARLVGNLSCGISILTLSIMSIERCCAIVKPMRYKSVITTRRLKVVLYMTWLFCFITPSLDAFIDEPRKQTYVQFTVISMALLYVVIILSYAYVFQTVKKQSYQRRQLSHATDASKEAEKKLAKTVAFVIGLFTLCWSPFAVRMVFKPSVNYGSEYIWTVTASLANSVVNPILYFYRSHTFRNALKNIFKKTSLYKTRIFRISPAVHLQNHEQAALDTGRRYARTTIDFRAGNFD